MDNLILLLIMVGSMSFLLIAGALVNQHKTMGVTLLILSGLLGLSLW